MLSKMGEFRPNLFQANLGADNYLLRGANHFLGICEKYLREVKGHIEAETLPVHLELLENAKEDHGKSVVRPSRGSTKDRENGIFTYCLKETAYESTRQYNRVRAALFDENLFSLQSNRASNKSKEIHIYEKDEQQGLVSFFEKLESHSLYFKPDTYQIRKQIEAVQNLRYRPIPAHQPLLALFGSQERSFISERSLGPTVQDWHVLRDLGFEGTDEQRDFVEKALNTRDFALLEGPPGSGKTTTIIELIIQLALRGKRILLCSATHVAIDNVLDRILTKYHEACKDWIMPVRICANEASIHSESVKPYRLQSLVRTKREELREQLQKRTLSKSQEAFLEYLKDQAKEEHGSVDDFARLILDSANLVAGTSIGILQHPDFKKGTVWANFDVLIVDEASKVTFQEFLVPALHAKKWILVGDVHQLSPYVEDDHSAAYLETLIPREADRAALIDLYQVRRLAQKQREEVLVYFHEYWGEMHEAYLYELEKMGRLVLSLRKASLRDPDLSLKIQAADILFCEPTEAVHNFLAEHLRVKAHFIHEGPGSPQLFRLQSAFHRGRSAGNKFVPNWITTKTSETWGAELASKLSQYYSFREDEKLKERIQEEIDLLVPEHLMAQVMDFKRIVFPSILEILQRGADASENQKHPNVYTSGMSRTAKQSRFTSLTYQHRMHPDIADTSRIHFYEGENLLPGSRLVNRPWGYKTDNERVEWVVCKPGNGLRSRIENLEEVQAIEEELRNFLWYAKDEPNQSFEVAVLTFYRDQELLLKMMLRRLTGQHQKQRNFAMGKVAITLCTVDRFQGQEADLVLLCFTKVGRLAHYHSPNRLNVALTRARHKLILFGDKEWMRRHSPSPALQFLANNFHPRLTTKRK